MACEVQYKPPKRLTVRCFYLILLLAVALAGGSDDASSSKSKSRKPAQGEKPRPAPALSALTGCLDEKPGPVYSLREEGSLKTLADLQPEAFPLEGFAKYLGHKVTVKGRLETGDPAILRVRTVERLSEECSPAPR